MPEEKVTEGEVRRLNELLARLLAVEVGRPEDLIEAADVAARLLNGLVRLFGVDAVPPEFRYALVNVYNAALPVSGCQRGMFPPEYCRYVYTRRFEEARRMLEAARSSIVVCCDARLGAVGPLPGHVLDLLVDLARREYTVLALDENLVVVTRDGVQVEVRREGEVYRVSGSICESAPAVCSYRYRTLYGALRDVVTALERRYAYA